MIIHIDRKGIFLSKYSKEELYEEGKVNLKKFSEAECVSGCTFAEELVSSAIEGTLGKKEWRERYSPYIKYRVFYTYQELNSLVKLLTNPTVKEACIEQTEALLDEFYVFYTALYGYEERIIENIPEQFFVPCFYPAVKETGEDIDIYSQYDRYGLVGFANALFNYSLNKSAFDLLRINSDEMSDIQILAKKLEKAKSIPCPEFDGLQISSIRDQLVQYKTYMLDYIRQHHKDDIAYIDNKKVEQRLYQHEQHALESIRANKDIIPNTLYLALETIEGQVVEHLKEVCGAADIVMNDTESRILAVYKSKKIKSKADWGVVCRLMVEMGVIEKDSFAAAADIINRVCGQDVTSAESIRKSPACCGDLKGNYSDANGWSMRTSTRQTARKLELYKQIAAIYMGE